MRQNDAYLIFLDGEPKLYRILWEEVNGNADMSSWLARSMTSILCCAFFSVALQHHSSHKWIHLYQILCIQNTIQIFTGRNSFRRHKSLACVRGPSFLAILSNGWKLRLISILSNAFFGIVSLLLACTFIIVFTCLILSTDKEMHSIPSGTTFIRLAIKLQTVLTDCKTCIFIAQNRNGLRAQI
jgi:hypothetical protein